MPLAILLLHCFADTQQLLWGTMRVTLCDTFLHTEWGWDTWAQDLANERRRYGSRDVGLTFSSSHLRDVSYLPRQRGGEVKIETSAK